MIYRAYTQFNNYIPGPHVNFILFCREYFILIWIFFFCYEFSLLFCCEFFILFWQLWAIVHFFGFPSAVFFNFLQDLFYFPSSLSNSFYFPSAVLLLSFIDSLFSFSIFFFYFPSAFLFFIFYPPFQISSFAHRFAFTSFKRLYNYLRKPRASRMLVN